MLKKLKNELKEKCHKIYNEKEEQIGTPELRELERIVMLKIVDNKWMDHIDNMDELKNGIGLRAYGQKNPVVQYRMEGFEMFDQMVNDIKIDVVKILMHIQKKGNAKRTQTVTITGEGFEKEGNALEVKDGANGKQKEIKVVHTPITNAEPKIGRNEPCPCRKSVRSTRIVVEEMHKIKLELWKHSSNFIGKNNKKGEDNL